MATVGSALLFLIYLAIFLLIARLVLDWVQMLARSWRPTGVLAVLCEGLYSVTDPPVRAVRSLIPPIRIGSVMLDLSLLLLLIALQILQVIVSNLFF